MIDQIKSQIFSPASDFVSFVVRITQDDWYKRVLVSQFFEAGGGIDISTMLYLVIIKTPKMFNYCTKGTWTAKSAINLQQQQQQQQFFEVGLLQF